jgi:molecular chaperone DnaJ
VEVNEDLGDLLGGNLGGFSDFFEMLFGQGSGRASRPREVPRPGPAVAEQTVDVTLAEAYSGVERVFDVETQETCAVCRGSGHNSAGGTCANCHGTGRQVRSRRIEAKIPAGVETGSRITYRGGGGSSDLVLVVNVLPDPVFRREGSDLHVDVPVELSTAMLGGEVTVPAPKGRSLLLKIPAESANGQQFVLRGQGMPRLQAEGRGNLYARLSVVLPRHLTARERELFAELARSRSAATAAR